MGRCFEEGISGNCGVGCDVFQDGECDIEDLEAFYDTILNDDSMHIDDIKELYPGVFDGFETPTAIYKKIKHNGSLRHNMA